MVWCVRSNHNGFLAEPRLPSALVAFPSHRRCIFLRSVALAPF